jgi:translation initiation factor 4E
MRDQDGKEGSTSKLDSPRTYTSRRFGDTSSHGKSNPFNTLSPSATKSPSASASSAFGLGSGAFASFGSAKTPKTPGTGAAFDFSSREKVEKKEREDTSTDTTDPEPQTQERAAASKSSSSEHHLRNTWNLFYRPPANKFSDYEKSTLKLASISTAETFWTIYSHLKSPSQLPTVSDYHIFKDGIRPVWEDEANKKGGKWIVRLKKGVADRYWEDLLLAIIGDQFLEAGEEVCGAVLSVRSGEDVLSVWTKNDGGRNIKIR